MKLCYQLATPEVTPSFMVTSYQGDMEAGFRLLRDLGYDGVELMMRNPAAVNQEQILSLASTYRLEIPMLCTGEVFGQDNISLTDPDDSVRTEAKKRAKDFIDFAAKVGAGVNIGRFRGQYRTDVQAEQTNRWAMEGFQEMAFYAGEKGVNIALEAVNLLQSNFLNTTQEAYSMTQVIGRSNFGIMLDLFHMHLEDKDILHSIEECIDRVFYVHYTDTNRRYPGSCKMDFQGITEKLRDVGYDGYIGVEVFQVPDSRTAMEESAVYLKQVLYEAESKGRGNL